MGVGKYLLLFTVFVSFLYIVDACTMEGVDDWRVTQDVTIVDVEPGTFWDRATSNINSIASIEVGGSVNYANYFDVLWDADSGRFTISTSNGYEQYEENETSQTVSFTVRFSCTGGGQDNFLTFDITVQDTNNNPPTFKPTDQYEFTITPPLPPGFQITGCGGNDIVVRDVDLTTSSIEFTIEDNPYFEIEYAGRSSTDPKEFLASLKTKDLIRSLSQDIVLTITATDVDGTPGPPITSTGTITVKADEAFLFPEEPVFAQPFYIATYADNQVVLDTVISLKQGYDEQVEFVLDGEYIDYFRPVPNGNEVSIEVKTELSDEILKSGQIILVVEAKREYTSGATATVIVELTKDEASFGKNFYEGTVQGGEVQHETITLSDYDGTDVQLLGEYADLFSATHSEGVVIIQGRGSVTLPTDVSHVALQLQAETASAVLLLDVKHRDEASFGKNFYEGTVQGGEVHHETITLSDYDGTDVQLLGEYADLFSATHSEGVVIIQGRGSVTLPTDVSHVALQLQAETASAVLLLDVKHSDEASFGKILYEGTVQGDDVRHETITLSDYDGTDVQLLGEYADLFTATHSEGVVIIQGRGSVTLPTDVSHVALQLQAETASAVLLLDVKHRDEASFGKIFYEGTVQGGEVLHETITLSDYEGTDVQLLGEHADLFSATHSEGVVIIQGRGSVTLPTDVSHVALQLQAETASAVLLLDVKHSDDASFGKILYEGTVQGNDVRHETITLSDYDGTDVQLLGEYADLFSATHSEGVVIIQGRGSVTLPTDVSHVALQLQAETASAVLLLDVKHSDEASFGKILYEGTVQGDDVRHETITLSDYAGTDVPLLGDYANLFVATHSGGVVIIQGRGPVTLPTNVSHVAVQLQAETASAVLLLDVKHSDEASFGKMFYEGTVQGGEVHHETITLSDYDGTNVQLLGEYADLFSATHAEGVVIIQGRGSVTLPTDVSHVALQLQAETASAVLLLEVKHSDEASFGKILYEGTVQGDDVRHETITLSDYDGTDVQLLGEYANLFVATHSGGVVIIEGRGPVTLPTNVFHVALQLQAETASAVLLLDVKHSDEASFGKIFYEGTVQGGEVLHETITLSDYDGTDVQLLGEYADLFSATHSEGLVIIQGQGTVVLPPNVFHVILQLQAETASAVLLLDVENSVTSEASFGRVLYKGSVQGGEVNHDEITLSGYDGTDVQLLGEYADLFVATHSEGLVIIRGQGSVVLPPNIFHVVLQLQADTASAVLLLDVENSVTSEASFGRVLYKGSVQNGEVNHDEITLSGFDGTDVQLLGEYADLFLATHSEGVVIIRGQGSVVLPPNILHVDLQLQAETASTVLLLDVENSVTSEASFGRVLYTGSIQGGEVNHDEITLSGYHGTDVQLLGEYADLFVATHSEGLVIIRGQGSVVLPPNIFHVVLQLQADTASAVLLLDVENSVTSEASFGRVLYKGSVQGGEVNHDEITLSGYHGTDVQLLGEYADLFVATHSEGLVIIRGQGSVVLPPNIFHVDLQLQAETASAVLLLDVENSVTSEASFGRVLYKGSVQGGEVNHDEITLSGYDGTDVQLLGEYADLFLATHSEGVVIIRGQGSVVLPPNIFHVDLQLQAETASAVLLLAVENSVTSEASFGRVLYTGSIQGGEVNHDEITLSGYDGTDVQLLGEYADLFVATHSEGLVIIRGQGSVVLPPNIFHVVLQLQAETASAVLLLDFENSEASFGRVLYKGSVQNGEVNHDEITLSGYDGTDVQLLGEYADLFVATHSDGLVIIRGQGSVVLPPNIFHVVLQLQADTASAVLLLDVENSVTSEASFGRVLYKGSVQNGEVNHDEITLSGFDGTDVQLLGEYADLFVATHFEGLVIIRGQGSVVLPPNIFHVDLQLQAETASAVLLLDVENSVNSEASFGRVLYKGSVQGGEVNHDEITLSGYDGTDVQLLGEYADLFVATHSEGLVIIRGQGSVVLPANVFHVVLQLQAETASAVLLLDVENSVNSEASFGKVLYKGSVQGGEVNHDEITLSGYDGTDVQLLGEYADLFVATHSEGLVIIRGQGSVVLPANVFHVVLQLQAETASAVLLLDVDNSVTSEASFGKVLYNGILQGGEVHHDEISLSGYDGTDVQLLGENAALFEATHSEEVVIVQLKGSVTLSPNVYYVALQLQAGTASAVLLLDAEHSDNPDLPSVSFNSPSYVIQTDVTQTGIIGRVLAAADNNEAVAYSLAIDDVYLLQRLYVSHYGELVLGAPVNSGVYNFDVIATTVFSKVYASVPVHLTVNAITIVDDDKYVLPPLQILNRDEESPHENLILFDASEFEGCRLSLSNRWPVDQNWLYVNENGLHANAIDREHESIAFMALSQIQVELILQCDGDDVLSRSTRSVNSEVTKHLEHLGPYDYGDRKWIISDSINYNGRRSLVNLIVDDINDNAPIFIGKENEPIVVGYPVSDLEERILPRSLIQVEATDADVGENAAIVYWSTADTLAVSPTTGSVHVRNTAGLENDMVLTVYATDRNGQGLTGSLDILVKLVDTSHIAVLTIKNAFLDNEQDILSNLSAAVGYEVKALRSTVISDTEEVNLRKKRQATISTGASMQLYVYGLIEREPVNVERLTEDINTGVLETVIVASTVSLEDHLEICPLLGRDTALLVSTIVLAVLLFILIVAAAVWFFLKWRKENYEEFTDENSLASQDDSVSPVDVSKPEQPTPRMNIEDLKRSERRLQEMLEAPLDVAPPPQLEPRTLEMSKESKVNIPEPPLVFQSFDKLKKADDTDDEDEFGEIKKNKRKSVVTFNENVEKIIHVEDDPDDDPGIEVFRL